MAYPQPIHHLHSHAHNELTHQSHNPPSGSYGAQMNSIATLHPDPSTPTPPTVTQEPKRPRADDRRERDGARTYRATTHTAAPHRSRRANCHRHRAAARRSAHHFQVEVCLEGDRHCRLTPARRDASHVRHARHARANKRANKRTNDRVVVRRHFRRVMTVSHSADSASRYCECGSRQMASSALLRRGCGDPGRARERGGGGWTIAT